MKTFTQFLNEQIKVGDTIEVLNDKYNIDNGPWCAKIVKILGNDLYLTTYDDYEYELKPDLITKHKNGHFTYG